MGLPTSSSDVVSLTGDENNRGSFEVGAGIPDEKPVVVVALGLGPPLEWVMGEGDEKVFIFVGWRGSGLMGVVIGRNGSERLGGRVGLGIRKVPGRSKMGRAFFVLSC